MIYANEVRPGLVASKPPEWARNIAEIGKALGAGWKALSAEERARYAEKAAALKKQFEEVDLPAAIKKAEEEEEARVGRRRRRRSARAKPPPPRRRRWSRRARRLKKRADEAAATAAAREERRRNRAASRRWRILAASSTVIDGSKSSTDRSRRRLFADGGERDENVTATRDMPGVMVSGGDHPTSLVTEQRNSCWKSSGTFPQPPRGGGGTSGCTRRAWAWCACAKGASPPGRTCRITSASCTRLGGGTSAGTPSRNASPARRCLTSSTSRSSARRDAAGVDTIFVEAAHGARSRRG